MTAPAKRLVKLLAFALVIHLFVIPQIGGARDALSVLGSVSLELILAALVLEVLAFGAYARLTQALIPAEHRPGLGISFGTVMASMGVNHVVPGGAATTAAVSYRLLGRAGVPSSELGFALASQAIGSAVVLNAILWLALLVSIPASGFHPIYGTAAAVGAVLIAAFSAAVIAMLRGRDCFAERVAQVLGHLPRVDGEHVKASMLKLSDQLASLAGDPQRLRKVVVLAAANWLFDAAALWVMLSAFGHRPNIVGLLVAYGLANLLAAVPVSPGGLGVIEAILIPTLVGFGTPAAVASVGVVAYRLLNFWLPIPVGAAAYVAVDRVIASDTRHSFIGEINRQIEAQPDGAE